MAPVPAPPARRALRWNYALALALAAAWIGNFLHLSQFGFYEDDWYFFATPYMLPADGWFAQMFAAMRQFVVGRPLQSFLMYVSGYCGALVSSIQILYILAFLAYAAAAVMMYYLLRRRFPSLFCALSVLLFVLSPLTTIRQFLNGQLTTGPAFIFVFGAMLWYPRRKPLSYLTASLALVTYESIFFLFLAAPFFEKSSGGRRVRRAGLHLAVIAALTAAYLFVRSALAEPRIMEISQGPVGTMAGMLLYDLFFTASSWKPYVYAMYVGVRELSLEAALYGTAFWIPALIALLHSRAGRAALKPFGARHFGAARRRWWLWNGVSAGLLLTMLGYALSYAQLYRDWTYPLSGRDTRASSAASFGSSMLVSALLILLIASFQTPRLRAAARVACLLFFCGIFSYSLVIQTDYIHAWEHQKSLLTQTMMLSPDVHRDTLFIVESPWFGEPLFPREGLLRRPSIGFQRHGLEVSLETMFGWQQAPRIFFTYSGEWRNYLKFLPDGHLHWTQTSFPGGWRRDPAEPITPGHIIVLTERPDGTVIRDATPVTVENRTVTQILEPSPGIKPLSRWPSMSASPLLRAVIAPFVSTAVMVNTEEWPFLPTRPVRKGTAMQARLAIKFPAVAVPEKINLGDPLLTTGRTGFGDVVSVRYFGNNNLRARIDHWGTPATESELIHYDPDKVYIVEVTMGDSIVVEIDGSVAAEHLGKPYPTTREQVVFGRNPIGGRTTKDTFAGKLLSAMSEKP